jgi:hypothetical protein
VEFSFLMASLFCDNETRKAFSTTPSYSCVDTRIERKQIHLIGKTGLYCPIGSDRKQYPDNGGCRGPGKEIHGIDRERISESRRGGNNFGAVRVEDPSGVQEIIELRRQRISGK